jgi:hypothetical protein
MALGPEAMQPQRLLGAKSISVGLTVRHNSPKKKKKIWQLVYKQIQQKKKLKNRRGDSLSRDQTGIPSVRRVTEIWASSFQAFLPSIETSRCARSDLGAKMEVVDSQGARSRCR